MSKSEELFLASGNPHKIEELQQILEPLGIQLKSTQVFKEVPEVVEDQSDLKGNALKKAQFWYQHTGMPSIADDTGLEVEALNGAPGVYSARYAGEDVTYQENVQKLLHELDGKKNRKAQFRTVIAYIIDSKGYFFEGVCKGKILTDSKGTKGFGYDPVFQPDGYDQSFAELDSEEKNKISHRGKALEKFVEFLK